MNSLKRSVIMGFIESGLPLGVLVWGLIMCAVSIFLGIAVGYAVGKDKGESKGYSKGFCKGNAQGFLEGWVRRHKGQELPEWAGNVEIRGWTHVPDLSDLVALEAGGFPAGIVSDDEEVIRGQQKWRNAMNLELLSERKKAE
jgi:hypothetical protein